LDGDPRQLLEELLRLGRFVTILEIEIDQPLPVQSENRKDDQDGKVRNQDREVERVGLVNAAKRIFVENLDEIAYQRVRLEDQGRDEKVKHID